MKIIAIDPGPEISAILTYEIGTGRVEEAEILPNDEVLGRLRIITGYPAELWISELPPLAIEMIASYGMAVGASVFDTCVWIGKFSEAWESRGGEVTQIYRKQVKLELCNSMKANDSNILHAIYDRYGGSRKAAVGVKAKPGVLYGLKSHLFAALGVAITWSALYGPESKGLETKIDS